MIRSKYTDYVEDLHKRRIALSEKKGSDYAGVDVLSNFKRVANIASYWRMDVNTPFGYSMFMCLMKFDRIMNLNGQCTKPKNESVDDSFMDFHNYLDLARAILIEENENVNPVPNDRPDCGKSDPYLSIG